MDDAVKSVKALVTFAGGVLVVAVLYWAQAVLVPFALAILLTFVLTAPVTWLQRWVGRSEALLGAGANHVASRLIETRNYLSGLLELSGVPTRTLSTSKIEELAATASE